MKLVLASNIEDTQTTRAKPHVLDVQLDSNRKVFPFYMEHFHMRTNSHSACYILSKH